MIDFSTLQGLTTPEGVVTQITDASGKVLWKKSNFILADGSTLVTSDGLIFNAKEE